MSVSLEKATDCLTNAQQQIRRARLAVEGMPWDERGKLMAEKHHDQALWYAWGWIDREPETTGLELTDGWTFALVYALLWDGFGKGEHVSIPSMMDAWKTFREEVAR